ncbi:MAG: toxin-antitoxin system HicB family antitoxin [Anaerolineales bacterium]|nr:toxin-antitoxin system HicB family antitoxin [Anaerolineales bacterium]
MQEMVKLTVRIPAQLHQKLKQRAQASDASLNATLVETLQRGLAETVYPEESREARFWRSMREKGLWAPLSPKWMEEYADVPILSHAELRELLKGVPPLSDIIIEERGPRE